MSIAAPIAPNTTPRILSTFITHKVMTSSSFAAALLLAITPGCGAGNLFEATPSIRGEIRAMIASTGGDDLGFARIVGKREEDTQYDRADVTITRTTTIFRRREGRQESLS